MVTADACWRLQRMAGNEDCRTVASGRRHQRHRVAVVGQTTAGDDEEGTEQGLSWGGLLWASVPRLVADGGACRSVACCAAKGPTTAWPAIVCWGWRRAKTGEGKAR